MLHCTFISIRERRQTRSSMVLPLQHQQQQVPRNKRKMPRETIRYDLSFTTESMVQPEKDPDDDTSTTTSCSSSSSSSSCGGSSSLSQYRSIRLGPSLHENDDAPRHVSSCHPVKKGILKTNRPHTTTNSPQPLLPKSVRFAPSLFVCHNGSDRMERATHPPDHDNDDDYPKDTAWYTTMELARFKEQLVPDASAVLVLDSERATHCLTTLRLVYLDCCRRAVVQQQEQQETTRLENDTTPASTSTSSRDSIDATEISRTLLRDMLQHYVYAAPLEQEYSEPRTAAADPPPLHVLPCPHPSPQERHASCHSGSCGRRTRPRSHHHANHHHHHHHAMATTPLLLGLERLLMGSSTFRRVHQERRHFVRQQRLLALQQQQLRHLHHRQGILPSVVQQEGPGHDDGSSELLLLVLLVFGSLFRRVVWRPVCLPRNWRVPWPHPCNTTIPTN